MIGAELVGSTWGREAEDAAIGKSNAIALRRVRCAGEPFIGRDAAKEIVAALGFTLIHDPDEDVEALFRESIGRLIRLDGRCGSPVVASSADVERCAAAMARTWKERA